MYIVDEIDPIPLPLGTSYICTITVPYDLSRERYFIQAESVMTVRLSHFAGFPTGTLITVWLFQT